MRVFALKDLMGDLGMMSDTDCGYHVVWQVDEAMEVELPPIPGGRGRCRRHQIGGNDDTPYRRASAGSVPPRNRQQSGTDLRGAYRARDDAVGKIDGRP
ncbi:MAG TPA: hypothetical protein VGU01_08565 [Sphingomicrobium sp.]|nr:hypothetical protein [Sphingomicrobium sp.]